MQTEWIERAEQVAREVLNRHAADVDRNARWPVEGIEALGQTGLLGLAVSPEFGGVGAGPRTVAAVIRILAEQCASTAMIYTMHLCAMQVIAQAETFPQRSEVLREVAEGRHLSALAFSEKGSRSHFWAPIRMAVIEGDIHSLTTDKSWVTSAGHADSYIVSFRSATEGEGIASTLYYVPQQTPGVSVVGQWNGLGMRGNASAPMSLNEARVPASCRVSGEGEGFGLMLNTVLPWFQLGSAAVSVGIAAAAAEATRRHLLAAKLEHLGQSLASLPNLRARLAQMQITVDTQRIFLDFAAQQMENPGPTTMLTVLESKAGAAEAALQVTDLAMRACGGAAFSGHVGVERNFRDARASAVMAPTTDVLHDFIGKSLLEMPLF